MTDINSQRIQKPTAFSNNSGNNYLMDLPNTQPPYLLFPDTGYRKKKIVSIKFYHKLAHTEVTDLHTHSPPA